ncbi:type I phosphomannose isomerase catalytic subunit [Anaerococcus nagyae]|uniref:type I phosphomannose isomerase catalytic subunit n=1 Tax=Anaerococcus nagyae TaxID=1755241 RepID=UPI001AEA4D6A|nr:type I phosphomannose isomerase catalytic subunit [Anaerococcus nagyae]MBP2070097.1 mannose-6-phosphate isomerase [Anaerococcus nagyae]
MQKVLILNGKFKEKIWGGDRLKKEFNYDINSNSIGEYWAISAMKDAPSTIINGDLTGKTLDEVYKDYKGLFANPTEETFPLLVKIIDAKKDLSIQVHPDDDMAKKLENSRGKTECWYILNDDQSSIIYGLNVDNKNQAIDFINNKKRDEVLREVPARKGDFFFVPAGTVHAIKEGCLILEIQQASDVTYRLYDYDRPDKNGNLRELHIEKSLEAIRINKTEEKAIVENIENMIKTTLTSNEFFEVREIKIKGKQSMIRNKDYLLESVIDGAGELIIDGEKFNIKKGDFFILTNEVSSYEFDGDLTIVESNVVR